MESIDAHDLPQKYETNSHPDHAFAFRKISSIALFEEKKDANRVRYGSHRWVVKQVQNNASLAALCLPLDEVQEHLSCMPPVPIPSKI